MNRTMTAILLLALATSPALGQEETKATADPTEDLKALAEGIKERKTNDDDKRHDAETKVVETLDNLLVDFDNYDPKAQKKVVGDIARLFKIRTKEGEDRIYMAAAGCLSEMGAQGESNLKKAMKIKHLEKKPDVQVMLIESLGAHRNPKNIELFTKLMNQNDTKIVIAAVKSLSQYRDADAKTRKKITESLVKQYANATNLDLKEKGRNPVWRQRLLDLEVPMNDALAALTLQSFQSSSEWEKWYNDHRNKKW